MRLAAVLFLIAWSGLAFGTAQPGPGRFALLVGVTTYPNFKEDTHLKGPANDVLLMRNLLITQFGFPADNIVSLTEHAGQGLLPTRANIEREFRRLAEKAGPGDQVVIFMAGHGSQQPEKGSSVNPEPDGLDEIFLPRDAAPWDRAAGTVANAITDDELGRWLTDIRAKQAFVWIIFDACHSGTMIRGVNEVARQIDPEGTLNIPVDILRSARQKALQRDGTRGVAVEGVRSRTRSAEAMKSLLGDILLAGMFGHGDTRSLGGSAIEDYQLTLLPWKVLPGKRAAEVKE